METLKKTLQNFVENWDHNIRNEFLSEIKRGSTKFIFNGPNGSGKNFLAESFANDYNLEFNLINLYTIDNPENLLLSDIILNRIHTLSSMNSLFSSQRKLIYIEGTEKLLRTSPIVFSKLNDIKQTIIIFESESGDIFRSEYKRYLTEFRIINFYRLNENIIFDYIKNLSMKNSIKIDESTIKNIAKSANGNLMSAITDLETYEKFQALSSDRNQEEDIFSTLNKILSGKSSFTYRFLTSDQDSKLLETWLADNLPIVSKGEKLLEGMDILSFTDILIRKINAQNWDLLKYISALLFGGISSLFNQNVGIRYHAPNWKNYLRIKS